MSESLKTLLFIFGELSLAGYSPPPGAHSLQERAAAYARHLDDLTAEELSTAARLFLRTDAHGKWPTPGALRAALGTATDWATTAWSTPAEVLPQRYQRPAAIAAEARSAFEGQASQASARKAHRETFAQTHRLIEMIHAGAAPPHAFPLTLPERSKAIEVARRIQLKARLDGTPLAEALLRNAPRQLARHAPSEPAAGPAWLHAVAAGALDALDADELHEEPRTAVLEGLRKSRLLPGGE